MRATLFLCLGIVLGLSKSEKNIKTIFVLSLRVLQGLLLAVMLSLICQEHKDNLCSFASSIGRGLLLAVILILPLSVCLFIIHLSLPNLSDYINLFCPLHKPKQTKSTIYIISMETLCLFWANGPFAFRMTPHQRRYYSHLQARGVYPYKVTQELFRAPIEWGPIRIIPYEIDKVCQYLVPYKRTFF